ncbi:hypothetical protein IWZ03DRAFT_414090 [Phyllosticta citriasiana]|uniref:Uncharacterized protein n=1 Tax=Phyllosticta citriasiana TaxID=595635 RepID=A0ABR1KQE7_9PEZI
MRLKMLPLLFFSFYGLVASASKVMIVGPAALESADMLDQSRQNQPGPAKSTTTLTTLSTFTTGSIWPRMNRPLRPTLSSASCITASTRPDPTTGESVIENSTVARAAARAAKAGVPAMSFHVVARRRRRSSNERSSNPTDTTTTYSDLIATAVRKLLEGKRNDPQRGTLLVPATHLRYGPLCARAASSANGTDASCVSAEQTMKEAGARARAKADLRLLQNANDMFRPIVEPPALSPPPPPPPPPPHEEIYNSQTSSSLDNNNNNKKKKKKKKKGNNTWRIPKLMGQRRLFKREDHKEFCDTDISSLLRMLACPPEKTHTPLGILSCAPDRTPNCEEIAGPPKDKTRSGDTWDA